MAARNGFTRRWAICMPDGSLYTGVDPRAVQAAKEAAAQYHSMNGYERDMMRYAAGIFGAGFAEPQMPGAPKPMIFDDYAEAEKAYDQLSTHAAIVGVTSWGGAIVESLCTPFTSGDPSVEFAEQIAAWVAEHGRGAR